MGVMACAALIVPIKVPSKLSARTGLEFSGAAWVEALSRYVVVSDDARVNSSKHEPLLFTLSDDGELDAAPIELEGIAELNDPESVTVGPNGTLLICTSHSLNKKGHVPESRRRLLQVAITADRHAKVLGQVDLSAARDAAGVPPWGQYEALDIEGIAFREGALYLGLKSPLGRDGSAMILRLPEVARVIASGIVPIGALSVWSRARFCVPRGASSVCEGIADLAFMPDGSLLLAANSPKGMASDGGGSLWKLARPNAQPILLKRFEGLKPEGVALSPNHSSVIIVFDTDGGKPVWIRWPLPS